MGYTRSDIIKKCIDALDDIAHFYKQSFINYRGKTSDTGELYNEIIAEFVCNNIDKFERIPMITRKESYKTKGHDGIYNPNSNRLEEITAMQMYNQCKDGSIYDFIGKIIDYQTPLKNSKTDDAGKIDLLSLADSVLYILELKKEDSTETMLRCILEGYTYLKTADVEKLVSDYGLTGKVDNVKTSPFVFKGREQWQEMQERRPWLNRLIDLLDTKPYYISKINEKYYVEEK
ncbi:MAG: hypothetical protein GX217_03980 [Clostridiaceae bacterium]|jgi:hypothetical protein|nr:hypothetical protein [Clostridiaceae bacterium]